ncbi:Superfamily I DNA and/or RNA helicase [Pseudobutyrivibrio sp. JW11]|uniref:DEAD/DEAH box helicase n=1 Tax=Pseudobutyrivibrio sp. JW11 TaxID=1855302 RepID=UPI0008F3971D|nr:AAA domain-containing protein [Pseudobutyrivibrio sp. JW11]SFO38953.1 Superfamily I DNA and/or RNA helicase [Pseudobutyrivibrio sp. JW11]
MEKSQLLAEKVLNYWFAIEFLSQDKYPDNYDVMNKVRRQKEKVAMGATGAKSLETFIKLKDDDMDKDLFQIISDETEKCGMQLWGDVSFYVGKVKRDCCIEEITKLIKVDYNDLPKRPEKSNEKIAMVSFQITSDGKFAEKSLSLSPVLWAMNKLKDTDGDLSEYLKAKNYSSDCRDLEEKFFGKNIERHESTDIVTDVNKVSTAKSLAVEAVKLETVKKLYSYIVDEYVRGSIKITDENPDAYEVIYGLSFQVFADEKTKDKKEDDNYLGLSHDYFSTDINMVLEKVKNNKLVETGKMTEDLQKYIEIAANSNHEQLDLINPINKYFHECVLNMLLRPQVAPLGKWPSRFMPAMMQEVAINAALNGVDDVTDGNGNIFSVNGPPGTGKTTLLKEVIVGNIVNRAILLSKYDNPDDAFDEHRFQYGDKQNNAYSKFVQKWYSLKNDSINDYSMLVTSCNNAAVENISKELPKSMLSDLKPLANDSDELKEKLREVEDLFDPDKSEDIETTKSGDEYRDVYFTKYARELLDDASAWGLIAAPLGKRSNLSRFYGNALMKIDMDFYVNKEAAVKRREKYIKARDAFNKQLAIVLKHQKDLDNLQLAMMKCTKSRKRIEETRNDSKNKINEISEQINIVQTELADIEKNRETLLIERDKRSELLRKLAYKNQNLGQEKENLYKQIKENNELSFNTRRSVSFITKLLNKKKYDSANRLADNYESEAARKQEELNVIEKSIAEVQKSAAEMQRQYSEYTYKLDGVDDNLKEKQAKIDKLKSDVESEKMRVVASENEYNEAVSKYEARIKAYDQNDCMRKLTIADAAFIEKLLSTTEESTDAQVENPWLTEQYNREREKLFALAMKLNKEFVLSSNHCRDNFKTLGHYWGVRMGDDGKKIDFVQSDKDNFVPAVLQTLFLFVPVVSTTFASVGNFLRDVKRPSVIGTLVVDEAGQAQPQMAVGALYRSRKAIIVGDPRQVEPVVTDDLALLKMAFSDSDLDFYKNKTLSVQSFADTLNCLGTNLDNNEGGEEWVGSPLVVHRRCISPMYDISNAISYNGIMKKKTAEPKAGLQKQFIKDRSEWIDVVGKERGNGDHFVEAQGEKVCELLEIAFSKNPEPSLYIISPFTTVVAGIKEYIKRYCKNHPDTKIDKDYMLDYEYKKIGTVHTFQGKEANEVIFLLGCDDSDKNTGIGFVNKNIVNVAVTRARYRLYIVGDAKGWKKSCCVDMARELLEKYR